MAVNKRLDQLETHLAAPPPGGDLVEVITVTWDDDKPTREVMTLEAFRAKYGPNPGRFIFDWTPYDPIETT
jgi:cytochrome oxidase Cu insertion factor (SCO1/SenC/PrrC family)